MKQDARALQTKKRLKESLLDLLRTRPLYEISVTELCRTSGIGRTTFYQHYGNLSQVLDELLAEILSQVAHIAAQRAAGGGDCGWHLCEFVRSNPRVFALFRNESLTGVILDRMTSFRRETLIRTLRLNSPWTEKQLEIILRFQTSGCLSLIRRSGSMDDEEWRRSKETVDSFLRKGLEFDGEDFPL